MDSFSVVIPLLEWLCDIPVLCNRKQVTSTHVFVQPWKSIIRAVYEKCEFVFLSF